MGPGWLSKILQADRDGERALQVKARVPAAGQWQQPVCRAGLHVGVFQRGREAGKLTRVHGQSRAQGQGHPSTPLPPGRPLKGFVYLMLY